MRIVRFGALFVSFLCAAFADESCPDVTGLTDARDACLEAKASLTSELEKAKEGLAGKDVSLQSSTREIETCRADRESLENKNSDLDNLVKDLRADVDDYTSQVTVLNAENSLLNSRLNEGNAQTEGRLASLSEENGKLVRSMQTKDEEIEGLSAKLKTATLTKDELEKELKDKLVAAEKNVKEEGEKRRKTTIEAEDLKKEVAALKERILWLSKSEKTLFSKQAMYRHGNKIFLLLDRVGRFTYASTVQIYKVFVAPPVREVYHITSKFVNDKILAHPTAQRGLAATRPYTKKIPIYISTAERHLTTARDVGSKHISTAKSAAQPLVAAVADSAAKGQALYYQHGHAYVKAGAQAGYAALQYVDGAVDEYVALPLMKRYPEVKELIPKDPSDKLAVLFYLFVIGMLVNFFTSPIFKALLYAYRRFRVVRFLVKLLFFPFKILKCMLTCFCCCGRRRVKRAKAAKTEQELKSRKASGRRAERT